MILNHVTFIRLGELVYLSNRNKSFTSSLNFFNIRKQTPNDGIGLLFCQTGFSRQMFTDVLSALPAEQTQRDLDMSHVHCTQPGHRRFPKHPAMCSEPPLLLGAQKSQEGFEILSCHLAKKTAHPRKSGYTASCPHTLSMDFPRNPPRKESSHKYDSILAK